MKHSDQARVQIGALRQHFRAKDRPEAVRNLGAALRDAVRRIGIGECLPAPRPYPEMVTEGEAWVHAGRYWICYTTRAPRMIVAVFYDEADIPGRRAR